ncbi:MAG TPA: PmeII family type II restriction endonuclease [Candidatus Bathyarchaeia archaeon]|nr:PmeII family type II restriction endonuclease [Candidatus Bathyarchaeia archaeon]
MSKVDLDKVVAFVDSKIADFHSSKLAAIKCLELSHLLKRKNPYLFKAKNITTVEVYVRYLLDAYLSSQEETMFGTFLEGLAIYVCGLAFGGQKAPAEGIDLDFSRDGKRYLVSVKSGPDWGNSGQVRKMKDDFRKAKKIIGQDVVCVNGCCYGRGKKENKGDYIKKCGQSFWEFISGKPEFYKEIVEPLGHKARERNDEFNNEYSKVVNKFGKSFGSCYLNKDKSINWEKIVEFNSSLKPPLKTKLVKSKPSEKT